jgi:K+-sensing histidine kinase KdpD
MLMKKLGRLGRRDRPVQGGKTMKKYRRLSQPESHGNEKMLNMLKIMSHDIRGSLVSISATLKLLIRGYYGKMGEGVANSLKELLSKTTGLIGTTDEYLGKTFLFSEHLEKEDEAINLMQDIITPVLKEFSPELKGHRILIDNRFEAISTKQISIKGSRTWLKAVFRNLLKNAIKYGDKDCTIAIGFEDHGSSFQVNVYNSGKPIPEEWREKLFSKFMRGKKNNDDSDADGVGLGLYLVKNIIKKQGGDMWYEAREDGSNFVFTLPHG